MYRNELLNIVYRPDEDMLLRWKCFKINFLDGEVNIIEHLQKNLRMKRQSFLYLFTSFRADRGDKPRKNVDAILRPDKRLSSLNDTWGKERGMVLGSSDGSVYIDSRQKRLIAFTEVLDGYTLELLIDGQDRDELYRLLGKVQREFP